MPEIWVRIVLRERGGQVLQGLDFQIQDAEYEEIHRKRHGSRSRYKCKTRDDQCKLKTLFYEIAREDNVGFRIVSTTVDKSSLDRLETESNKQDINEEAAFPSVILYLKADSKVTGPSSTDMGVKFTDVRVNKFEKEIGTSVFVELRANKAVPINL